MYSCRASVLETLHAQQSCSRDIEHRLAGASNFWSCSNPTDSRTMVTSFFRFFNMTSSLGWNLMSLFVLGLVVSAFCLHLESPRIFSLESPLQWATGFFFCDNCRPQLSTNIFCGRDTHLDFRLNLCTPGEETSGHPSMCLTSKLRLCEGASSRWFGLDKAISNTPLMVGYCLENVVWYLKISSHTSRYNWRLINYLRRI